MALEVQDLSVSYGPVKAVRGVSLSVKAGETVALIGSNGAGKTTILRAISGLVRQSGGRCSFDGVDLATRKPHEVVRLGLSHVPERRGIFANLTVKENLLLGAYTRKVSPGDLEEVFALFPRVRERLSQLAGTLSGGEQQMLAMSRALLARPRLLLLDEPSLGLAPQITKVIFEIITRINKTGTTVLLVEQNAFAALRISQRAYVLETGEITLSGPSSELLANSRVRKAYLGED
jgi:branched-chain amino acid transport system ATP-binding protein